VLLVNPWVLDFVAYDFWAKPVGLLTLGGILRESGYNVSLLDCMDRHHPWLKTHPGPAAESRTGPHGTGHYFKEIVAKPALFAAVPRRYGRYGIPMRIVRKELAAQPKPDLIMLTSGMTHWYPGVVDATALLKGIFPGVPVILGGIYASLCTAHAERVSGADAVVSGEGENRIVPLADALTGRRSEHKDYSDPDAVPPLPYDLYSGVETAALWLSRGCPFKCPFCASRLLSSASRRRNPVRVAEEMENLERIRGARHLVFYDDALLFQKESGFIPLLEEWIPRRQHAFLHTPNGIHPKWVDRRTAGLMKRAGFKTVRLSYESRDRARQASMGSKVTDDDLLGAVSCFLDQGFDRSEIGAYLIMGLPAQGMDEVLDTLLFVWRLGIKTSLSSFSPIPGTASWEEAVKAGFLPQGADPLLSNNSAYAMHAGPDGFSDFIRFGTLAALGNRIVGEGGMPLENPEFRRLLEQAGKRHPLKVHQP
jgi:radical SAM superfamily enzyme YgiQ (UPF0313 family)